MIRIKDAWHSFGGNQVLKGLDLHIPRGETLVIMGRSGVGKSFLLKLITGLIKPQQGEIWFDNIEISRLKLKDFNQIRRRVGMLFQQSRQLLYRHRQY